MATHALLAQFHPPPRDAPQRFWCSWNSTAMRRQTNNSNVSGRQRRRPPAALRTQLVHPMLEKLPKKVAT